MLIKKICKTKKSLRKCYPVKCHLFLLNWNLTVSKDEAASEMAQYYQLRMSTTVNPPLRIHSTFLRYSQSLNFFLSSPFSWLSHLIPFLFLFSPSSLSPVLLPTPLLLATSFLFSLSPSLGELCVFDLLHRNFKFICIVLYTTMFCHSSSLQTT